MRKSLLSGLLVLAISLGSVFAAGQQERSGKGESSGKVITTAMVSAWDSLIPFDTTSSYSDFVADIIFDKMVYLKADGTYIPRLAESWEMSDDNMVLTFHIDKNAKWHDGEPVTAQDVVFTSLLYSAPSLATARTNQFNEFAGFGEGDDTLQVKAIDDYTVQYTLKKPTNIDFLLFTKFRDVYILPYHLLGQLPYSEVRTSDYWKSPIGSGPGKYENQISGERIQFSANKDYHLKTPQWDRLELRVVTSQNLLSGLINGEIDVLGGGNIASLQLSDWKMAKDNNEIICLSTPSVSYQYMAINNARDYMTRPVRQAINYAINREVIVNKLLFGEGELAFSNIRSDNVYFDQDIIVSYDPEKARKLLKEEGWDTNRELIMSVPTGNTIREQSAVIIQQNLQEIGIKTKILSSDFPTHLTRVRNGEYDFGFIGSGGSPDPSESVINFNPDHLNNFAQLTDWTIFDTGAEGQAAFSFDERKALYDKFQILLKEEVPWAFLYFPNTLFAHRINVGGVTDVQDYSQNNRDTWNWTIE